MTNARCRSGYTIIEVLVGLTIVGLLFSAGFVSFREFSRRQRLTTAVSKIKGDLRLAQAKALAGEKPAVCAAVSLDSYGFGLVGGSGYQITACCSEITDVIKIEDIGSDLELDLSGVTPVILFNILGNGTNIPAGGSAVVTLTQTETGKTATVTVNAGGDIK